MTSVSGAGLQLRERFFQSGPGHSRRSEHERGERVLHHRDRPVQQVGRRKPLGYHIAGLHHLQRKLERIRVIQAARDDNRVIHKRVSFRDSA